MCGKSKDVRCVNEGVAWTVYVCGKSEGVRCVNEGVAWIIYVCDKNKGVKGKVLDRSMG